MSSQPSRWQQRFASYQKALSLLEEALARGPEALSTLEKEGTLQRFEFTFELAWKTLKDLLESEGIVLVAATPRQVIKEAFAARLIEDGSLWLAMLDQRNLLSHAYDAATAEQAIQEVWRQYLPALRTLRTRLANA